MIQNPSFASSAGLVATEHAATFATTVVSNAQGRSSNDADTATPAPQIVPSSRKRDGKRPTILTQPSSPSTRRNLRLMALPTVPNLATTNFISNNMFSKHRHSDPHGKWNACKCHLGFDYRIYHNRSVTVIRLLPPQVPFLRLSQLHERRIQRLLVSQTSNPNKTRCRISIHGATVAEVKDLHSPSKNGTSRPLRPPCLPPGSRFEHHLITPLRKGLSP